VSNQYYLLFEKVFIWFLGQPVVLSEPNISQIEAWSSSIYAWYQEFDFFLNFKHPTGKLISTWAQVDPNELI
jgi:hypothetical protein